jgi:hypothetical protein
MSFKYQEVRLPGRQNVFLFKHTQKWESKSQRGTKNTGGEGKMIQKM